MHSILAVAANTIKQAVRMKTVVVFVVLLAVLLPVMAVSMTGDGTLKGQLQGFVSYGLSLTSLLLCLLSITVSVYSLTSDIKQKHIYTVLSKPVRRFEVLCGKLLGVLFLDTILLVVFSASIYSFTIYMPHFLDADDAELAKVKDEFYTARATLKPPKIDISQELEKTFERLKNSGRLPLTVLKNKSSREKYKNVLANQLKLSRSAAPVGRDLLWEFYNVTPLEGCENLFIKFKYDVSLNPVDLKVKSRWAVGDIRQTRYATEIVTPIYEYERDDLIRTFHEIKVPTDAIADDGYLAVGFLNVPLNNTIVIFPPKDGLEVLYKADSFTSNFIKAVLLILLRLVFLTCLGLLTACFLSFPVAVLLCLAVFLTGTISVFIVDSFGFMGQSIGTVYSYILEPVLKLLPQFDKFNPVGYLVSARLLSWTFLAKAAVIMVGIKAVLLWALALFIFNGKEIAKITI